MNNMRTNTALIKLLGNASREQIEDFMNEYKSTYGEEEFQKLGDTLMWASYAEQADMVTSSEFENFLQKAMENPDLFPTDGTVAGRGISYGIQYL